MVLFIRPQIPTLLSSSHAYLKSCTPNLSTTPSQNRNPEKYTVCGTIRIAERVCSRYLRSPAIRLLVQPFTGTDFSRRAFRLSAPSVRNSLPRQFRSTTVRLLLKPVLKLSCSNRFLPNTDRPAVSAIEVRLLFFDFGRYIPEEGKIDEEN